MTIAASVDSGRSCTSPVPTTSSSARTPAPTSPASWLRAPTSSATAVRELLVEIGNPWKNPVAMFATPRHRELLVLVDLLAQPARVAARQDARVGERDEGDPDRGGDERLEVLERDVGHAERGQARGDGRRPPGPRRRGRARRPPPSRRRPRGRRRGPAARPAAGRGSARATPTPMASAVALVSSRPATKSRTAGMKLSASTENPNSLGSCATMTVTAMPIR